MANVLITGASRGIGRATALRLAQAGYDVGLLARNKENLQQVAKECEALGVKAAIFPVDICNQTEVKQALADYLKTFSSLDNLVLNHGITRKKSILEDQEHYWEQIVDVNLKALMYLTHIAAEHLVASKADKRALVFTASVASKISGAGSAAYSASKHGVLGFANSVFEDIREQGVKVSSIMPGFVNTDMVAGSKRLNYDLMIQVDDIAQTIQFVMEYPNTGCPTEIIVRPQRTPYK